MHRLSHIEAQRVCAILEETVEKLSFLGTWVKCEKDQKQCSHSSFLFPHSTRIKNDTFELLTWFCILNGLYLLSIQPDVLAHRDELTQIVGDEISRIIHEQRKLESRYEGLVAQRGSLKVEWFLFFFNDFFNDFKFFLWFCGSWLLNETLEIMLGLGQQDEIQRKSARNSRSESCSSRKHKEPVSISKRQSKCEWKFVEDSTRTHESARYFESNTSGTSRIIIFHIGQHCAFTLEMKNCLKTMLLVLSCLVIFWCCLIYCDYFWLK